MDPSGADPLFEWGLNTNSGHIEETTRNGNRERIVEREVHPDTLKIAGDVFNIELPSRVAEGKAFIARTSAEEPKTSEESSSTTVIPMNTSDQRDWDNMEM